MQGKQLIFKIFKTIIQSSFGTGFGKNLFVRKCVNFLITKLSPDYVEIEGNKMIVNSLDNFYLALYEKHEAFESECIKKVINPGDCVIDIGANQGYFSLFFAKLVGKRGKVFAFEPDSENCLIIKKNIKLNNYKNIQLFEKAVTSTTGKIRMYIGNYRTGNRIYESNENKKSVMVNAIKLDDFFEDFQDKVNFIKIDVEGAEFSVIEGMKQFLENNEQIIIMTEFFPNLIKKFGKEPRDYLDLLIKKNFQVYHMDEKNEIIKPLKINEILEEFTPKKENWTNLLCFKGHNEVIEKIMSSKF